MLTLITGATGLLGSHIAEQLVSDSCRVRALVRPGSDTRFLKDLDIDLVEGDLRDLGSIRKAAKGVDVVYHCAAFVRDWGPWREFYRGIVETTRNLVDACRAAGHPRILHVSSISVYGRQSPSGDVLSKELSVGRNHWLWDYYGKAKALAEQQLDNYPDFVLVRPSWIYGPRDRVSIPRVVEALRAGRFRIIGSGENPMNMVYAADAARGAILAANTPPAKGRAYHLCSPGEITQRALVDLLCSRLDLRRVNRSIPLPLAWYAAFAAELAFRVAKCPQPPPVTRRAIYMIGRSAQFSIAETTRQLGWQPETPITNGLEQTLDWYLSHQAARN